MQGYIFSKFIISPPPFRGGIFFPQIQKGYTVFPKAHFFSPSPFFLNKFFPKPNFFLLSPLFPPSFSLFFSFFFFFFFFFLFFSLFPFPFPLFSFTPFLQLDISSFFFPGPFPPPQGGGVKMENIYPCFFVKYYRVDNNN